MGKYFTEKERYKLESLLDMKAKPKDLATYFNKSVATIYNEIKRGTVTLINSELIPYQKYCADVAHNKYLENRKNKGISLKIGNDYKLVSYIEKEIKVNKRSPKAVIGYIRSHNLFFDTSICFKTLYNYIDMGLFLNITNKDLLIKKHGKKRHYHKVKVSLNNPCAKTIDERPADILNRSSFGHWEMDTVVSGKNKGTSCLLVLSERMSRKELIYKIPSKHTGSVVSVLDKIEKKIGTENFRLMFKTLTVDNGTEFLDTKGIEKHNRTTVYYCHPYSSWERGTNENINKMIRRFIPKGSSISKFTSKYIKSVENWINNYPREIHGFLSANEVLEQFILKPLM